MSCVAIFMGKYTFRGQMGPTCHTSQARPTQQVRPALPVPRPRSRTLPSPCAQLGWTRFTNEMSVWSNGWSYDHLDQWFHLSGRPITTTIIPRASWASPSEGGSSHSLEVGRPHLPAAILTKTDTRNRPSTASGARIRSIQFKRRWIIGSAAPIKMGSRPQPTSLTYKRSRTPAGSHTPRRSISFPLFSSLRVGLV
jgi:hypothetical protein